MTRELSKLGGVPKGSASSAILLPAGSKISNTDAAVPRKPMSRRISPEAPAIVFAELNRLTRIRRENPAFNYGFFRPNPLAFEGQAGKNAGHGRDFTGPRARNKPKLLDQVRDVIRRKTF
jgi:hypothetical protein